MRGRRMRLDVGRHAGAVGAGVAVAVVAVTVGLTQPRIAQAESAQSPAAAAEAEPAGSCAGSALPTLGGRNGNAVAISSSGVAVGIADDARGVSRPVIWRGGKATMLQVRLDSAVPTGVNARGVVVGTGYDAASEMLVGWWWSKGATHELPVRHGDIALPETIDDRGRVVGALVAGEEHSDGPGADEDERAAFWPSVHAFPRELPPVAGDAGAHAFAIAPDGTVGGVSLGSGGTPVLWDRQSRVHRLGGLSAKGGLVRGFDGQSDPVGQAAVRSGGTHAVTWNGSGDAVDLGTLTSGNTSAANAAAPGVVAGSGTDSVPGGSTTLAVAWIGSHARILSPVSMSRFRGTAGSANSAAQVSGLPVVAGFSADAVGVRKPTIWRCEP